MILIMIGGMLIGGGLKGWTDRLLNPYPLVMHPSSKRD